MKTTTVISVSHLTKCVSVGSETLTILDNLSFSVAKGESVAIVGSSGSGKSTLLSILAGLDVPTEGTVLIDGRNVFDLSEDDRAAMRARSIGVVFQTFQLLPMLTAWENVMLPLEIARVSDAESQAALMLDRVGLSARLKHYPAQLSGGEQQRVALARAFVTHPGILFADEPTGSLDSENGHKIMALMFDMHRELNTTLVLVTHDMRLARRCSTILRLEGGVMTKEGKLSDKSDEAGC